MAEDAATTASATSTADISNDTDTYNDSSSVDSIDLGTESEIQYKPEELVMSIWSKDWNTTIKILQCNPQLAKPALSTHELGVIWTEGPGKVIRRLMTAWPDSYKEKAPTGRNLIQTRSYLNQWRYVKSFIKKAKYTLTEEDIEYASRLRHFPLDLLEVMLDILPNVALKYPKIIFDPIRKEKFEHFRAAMMRCPAAAELKNKRLKLTPLLMMFQDQSRMDTDWIGTILNVNPNAARAKDYDGKTPLHLAYQHEGSQEVIDMIWNAYPQAEYQRDNLGRTPKELVNLQGKLMFTPLSKALVLDGSSPTNERADDDYRSNAIVLCRGDVLMRDIPLSEEGDDDEDVRTMYSEQVLARHKIFATLLDEFSKMVGIDNKDIIQKAATIQALAAEHLSHKDGTIIDFELFDNPGYWYQQETLKLVMRIYHEAQSPVNRINPSIEDDARICLEHLEMRINGQSAPNPSKKHIKAFHEVSGWLTEGLDSELHFFQGPALKPLQSLFNKLFIRRGQTTVHVIGDMVRGTLLLDDEDLLREVVTKINATFPNITHNQFKQPDDFDGVADFLCYVHDDLKHVPNSKALPYRFKKNSSQKRKKEPLWYNFNFFLEVPEYHQVGHSGMFVACELQVGLTSEVTRHRKTHHAYERDRILSNQPLLQNYDSALQEVMGQKVKEADDDDDNDDGDNNTNNNSVGDSDERDEEKLATEEKEETNKTNTTLDGLTNSSDDDAVLVEKVLFGRLATEILVPRRVDVGGHQRRRRHRNSFLAEGFCGENISLEGGPFAVPKSDIIDGSIVKPEQLCINNRSLNWYAHDGSKSGKYAFVVAGPFVLDDTNNKRYFVESFAVNGLKGIEGTIGLYARIGSSSYMIEVACEACNLSDMTIVESGRNYTYLEQVCPIPAGTTSLEVIVKGSYYGQGFGYGKMELTLMELDKIV